ncbi:MAG: HPF/RaiA family ribosome-associated protein, partial [Bacilli bacterium]|nr:HPF/RaiA family ribosome-associated protein [Bacilli bacterium]
MKYQIVGKNVSITPAIESKILKKLSTLDKFLIVKDSECRVVITIVPDGQKIEVTIQTKYAILRG